MGDRGKNYSEDICGQGAQRPWAVGQKQEGAWENCSDVDFKSHCIYSGHFLVKWSLALLSLDI